LTPELLIKDDSLVNVDYITRTNYLKVTINGDEQYVDISNRYATFPKDARIQDASSLQPFSLRANENKQIWVTVHVPESTPAGDYYGNMVISAPSEVPVVMNLSVRVLPFELEPSPLEYGLYNYGILGTHDATRHSYRSPETYSAELRNMIDHGVLYPTLYQQDNGELDTALALRDAAGLPKDKIYLVGVWEGHDSYIGSGSTPAELAEIASTVKNMRNHTKAFGYNDTYFYGLDEVKGEELLSQRAAWQTVHANDGKIFAAGRGSELLKMADVLDTGVTGSRLNATQAALFHTYGCEILSYGNPQAGIENPEIYRANYGFALWNAGYDGAMDFAYQFPYGKNIWNDYDDLSDGTLYRDHVFAYPTSDGVIDTIQWEGWREGVDDTRYVASLIKKEGSNKSAKTIVSAGLSGNEDMSTIRKLVIDRILSSRINRAPVFAVIGNKSADAGSPLTFTVSAADPDTTRLTYSVASLPPNATFNSTTGTFAWTPIAAQAGTYAVTFTVTDGSLNDSETVWITAIGKAVQTTPASPGTLPVVMVVLLGLAVFLAGFRRE
ncbi:MAG: Ig domain-containing protein, partial [Methanoregula sp.]|nr:Ig domain-containing protein [Methanoregula sp.]